MITKQIFDKFPAGEIFSTGITPNSPEGLFMTNDGGMLRWVAVKGFANDWTIYCHWVSNPAEWIKANGDKVINEKHIRRCVPCDNEVFNAYRY